LLFVGHFRKLQNQLPFTYSFLLSIGEVSIKKQGSNKHGHSGIDREKVQTTDLRIKMIYPRGTEGCALEAVDIAE
jgi:hypothetical protein